jgi:hypothetical protein
MMPSMTRYPRRNLKFDRTPLSRRLLAASFGVLLLGGFLNAVIGSVSRVAAGADTVVGGTGQPDDADNPTYLGSSHVGAPSEVRSTNSPPLQGATGQLGLAQPPTQSATLPNSPAGPAPTLTVPSATGSTTGPSVGPAISYVNQFEANGPYQYGDPPDNAAANSGLQIGESYNGGPCQPNCFEVANFDSVGGQELGSFTMCGVMGYTGCSDIQLLWDRASGGNRWVFTYLVASPNTPGGALAIGVSKDWNALDGFYIWGLGQVNVPGSSIDAPRIGITSDKVVLTLNIFNACVFGSACTDEYVINKSQLYSLNGFNFDTYQQAGTSWQPVKVTSNEQTTLFEAPDSSTGGNGTMRTSYLTGPQGGETFTTTYWTIGNDPPYVPFYAIQPNSNYTLDADQNEFEDAIYTGNVSWVDGNAQCSNGQLCPMLIAFNDNSNHKPTSIAADWQVQASDGSSLFYPALSTTISSNNALGILDFTCWSCNPGEFGSAGTFEFTTGGSYSGGAYEAGNSDIAPDYGVGYHRWGDFNGCSYVPGSSPAQATCIAQYAYNGLPESEVITVSA